MKEPDIYSKSTVKKHANMTKQTEKYILCLPMVIPFKECVRFSPGDPYFCHCALTKVKLSNNNCFQAKKSTDFAYDLFYNCFPQTYDIETDSVKNINISCYFLNISFSVWF